MSAVIVWFRDDLRVEDHESLQWAIEQKLPVIPIYIYHDTPRPLGAASQWWLYHALEDLNKSLGDYGGKLLILRGNPLEILQNLVKTSGARAIAWHRRYDQASLTVDSEIKTYFKGQGLEVKSFPGNFLHEPQNILNKEGRPFRVFTPFWKHCLTRDNPLAPIEKPKAISFYNGLESLGLSLADLELLPTKPDWAAGFREAWVPSEQGAHKCFESFLENALEHYKEDRNRPDLKATSYLSPYLRFGQISVRFIWQELQRVMDIYPNFAVGGNHFLSELGWREFSYNLLHYNSDLPTKPLQTQFEDFPWLESPEVLQAWKKGQTGYPIVDAGMRELWHTGYMHNRVRMIVASFLVKDLLIPWQSGEEWFWDTLVDADLANNSASWQWVAGCGADAAPYFRVFNPVLQGQKFDPKGDYVRKWLPELGHIKSADIHTPGLLHGNANYPQPIIDHDFARKRALQFYEIIKLKK